LAETILAGSSPHLRERPCQTLARRLYSYRTTSRKIPPMTKQRILLVDDHEVVRLGLKSLLERHPQFEVVGEAGSAREALEQVAALKPEVVLMDIRLPGTSGIEACEEIVNKYPGTRVIMLTSYAEDEMLFSAIRAGASGYILKQIGSSDLVKALEAVSRGEALLDPAVTQRVFQEVRRAVKEEEASAFAHLSQQEKHVLLLVSEGKTNREIAKSLFLGEGTVRNYVSSILSKLGVNNRAEAAAYAVEHSLREYIST
jgi:two-component system response regulator DevR